MPRACIRRNAAAYVLERWLEYADQCSASEWRARGSGSAGRGGVRRRQHVIEDLDGGLAAVPAGGELLARWRRTSREDADAREAAHTHLSEEDVVGDAVDSAKGERRPSGARARRRGLPHRRKRLAQQR